MRIKSVLVAASIWMMMFIGTAWPEQTSVVCEGKYVMGDLDTKKDAKALALMDAKRIALEKAGTYLESSMEVKNYELTRDQINALAAGIISVDILKEDWQLSGESMAVIVQIKAVIDTSHLKERIAGLKEHQDSGSNAEIQKQISALQKELAELKAQKAVGGSERQNQQKTVEEKHASLIKQMTALDYAEQGNAAMIQERWEDAATAFTHAVELNPKAVEAWTALSICYMKMKHAQEAMQTVEKGLSRNPQDPKIMAAKAMILKYQPGKAGQALEIINQAIARQPKNKHFHLLQGEIYMKLGEPVRARGSFRAACDLGSQKACQRLENMPEKNAERWQRKEFQPKRLEKGEAGRPHGRLRP